MHASSPFDGAKGHGYIPLVAAAKDREGIAALPWALAASFALPLLVSAGPSRGGADSGRIRLDGVSRPPTQRSAASLQGELSFAFCDAENDEMSTDDEARRLAFNPKRPARMPAATALPSVRRYAAVNERSPDVPRLGHISERGPPGVC